MLTTGDKVDRDVKKDMRGGRRRRRREKERRRLGGWGFITLPAIFGQSNAIGTGVVDSSNAILC